MIPTVTNCCGRPLPKGLDETSEAALIATENQTKTLLIQKAKA